MATKREEPTSGKAKKPAKKASPNSPQVIQIGVLDMAVCVPEGWTDDQIVAFARQTPCGTSGGWQIHRHKDGETGAREQVPCRERPGYIHVLLDA